MQDRHLGGDRPLRSLVTGGAGFVGSHLCERLIAEGHEVIGIDNLLTGREENLAAVADHPRFVFVRHDVTHPIDLPQLLRQAGERFTSGCHLDYILHLASPASPKDYARHPIHTMKVGGLGTYHALGLAKACDSVFLLASTSEVYGDPEVNPQPETYWGHVNPIGPRSCYDEAKRFAEAITMAYHRQNGVQVRLARIFNTYGERMRLNDGRVLPNFIPQALQGQPLTVYGDGTQTRSCCYVSDLVDGLYRLLVSDQTGPVNLGNPEEVSMLDLARKVIEQTGSSSAIAFQPLPVDDPTRRRPDISKAVTLLGWQPKVGLAEGLAKAIAYFKAELRETAVVSGGVTGPDAHRQEPGEARA
ncbi:MAG TPA: UDP-glucuronic acid decarboxylase family protein [Terriglobia bacterium]